MNDQHPTLRRVYQTIWGQRGLEGWENCKEASVATLLGLDLRDITPFNGFTATGEYDPFTTHVNMQRWFRARGLTIVQLHAGLIPDCYYLAVGPTCRVPDDFHDYLAHMVVMRAGQLAHDPIRNGRGLWRIDAIYVVIPQSISELTPHGWHTAETYTPRFEPEPLDTHADAQPQWLRGQPPVAGDSVWTMDWDHVPF